jgi:hypothetical protein
MTVRMEKEGKFADVHKDEVDNYASFGWSKATNRAAKNVLFDVYKVTEGEESTRASKINMTKEAAEKWVAKRDDTYNIKEAD